MKTKETIEIIAATCTMGLSIASNLSSNSYRLILMNSDSEKQLRLVCRPENSTLSLTKRNDMSDTIKGLLAVSVFITICILLLFSYNCQ